MNVYAIRHIPTGLYMPLRRQPKGHSNWTPGLRDGDYETTHMRIFPTLQAARSAMHSWLRGRVRVNYQQGPEDLYPEPDLDIIKDPTRRKQDVEVVAFTLVPVLTATAAPALLPGGGAVAIGAVQAAGLKVATGMMGKARFHGELAFLNKP